MEQQRYNHMSLPQRTHDQKHDNNISHEHKHKHAHAHIPTPTPTLTPTLTHPLSHTLLQQQQHQQQHQQHQTKQQQLDSRLSTLPLPPSDPATTSMFDRLDRPFKLPLYPPPSYTPSSQTELPPIKSMTAQNEDSKTSSNSNSNNTNNKTSLPSLSALTAASSAPLYTPSRPLSHPPEPAYSPPAPPAPPLPTHWPSLNPLTAYYTPSHVQNADSPLRMDIDTSSNSGVSAASPDRFQDGRASSVSLDDPDVRMAAEALGDLRADFVSSPPDKHTPLPASSPHPHANGPLPEPLISLLTTSHPLLATTIEGATSAYNNSKNYSPRFKTSAEYVEGYVIPIANTVGSVGRVTGVEGGVRWFLSGGNRHKSQGSDMEVGDEGSNKRRKVNGSRSFREQSPELESGAQTPRASLDNPLDRRLSVASTIDTLPAYDEMRSPPYAEHFAPPETRPHSAAWQHRLIMSTSGLSIAMSEESLRSLKYCLSWLRWANEHIGNVINSLKITMEKYEQAKPGPTDGDHLMQGVSSGELADRNQLAAKITDLKSDVLKTLQDVINTVSRYAGGALPENARELVRHHLTSLPQRFRVASMMGNEGQQGARRTELSEEEGREAHEKETRESAQRVLVLAKEGLDMMSQVSGVLDGTIVSAEEWCDRLGRRKREQREDLLGVSPIPQVPLPDSKTG